ncbi:WD40 repeat domain-containing protein [Desertifilum sp. FACHB-1129]|uniref:Uncharacterized protein n=1 Tax=Desertifilum tharense IPPAS B-1220 TaxID=1781255 RepID=A0A1E5QLD7_9CYAN|nr:WD40 repeat domain-containing protein [Desertifilum sp. FACHB-1129]MBD2321696.1 WD40 repeat domain-containing protein [Desertifilum sp. FACHB-866]MBD2331823.1 WD40 repeat domain-containing protein [Desertifilum sp. FACHB-868]OEJ75414.1 hypothetical protein BH720_09705 [Desertifilum tharense IPPAS B-1220]
MSQLAYQTQFSEYVTAIAYSPNGQTLAISTAEGAIALWQNGKLQPLTPNHQDAVNAIAFSADGRYFASGGQDGRLLIWQLPEWELVANLEHNSAWVEHLAWSPHRPHLAFSYGRYVQVWDAQTQEVVVTLNFEASSVSAIAWHPIVEDLAIAGYQGVKIWSASDWDDDPETLVIPSASCSLAWSPNGEYLAAGNLDNTLVVTQWGSPYPWVMRGFPGKVRALAWSQVKAANNAPLLVAASAEGAVVWEKQADDNLGWQGRLLEQHTGIVSAIAFQPRSLLLASSDEAGELCLWQKASQLTQTLQGVGAGFSCLTWHPQGKQLAAGGKNGELLIWEKSTSGKGFGR